MDDWRLILPLSISLFSMLLAYFSSFWSVWQKVRYVWPLEPIAVVNDLAPHEPASEQENPYAAPRNESLDSLPLSKYAKDRIFSLECLMFQSLGTFRTLEADYRYVRYELWLSPSKETLAVVACGRRWFNKFQYTQLLSFCLQHRFISSLDSEGATEYDFSQFVTEKVYLETSFEDLLSFHYDSLGRQPSECKELLPEDALQHWREYRRQRVQKLVAAGQARFLDAEENRWQYQFQAAAIYNFRQALNELRRSFWPDGWAVRWRVWWERKQLEN
jgi:hypothetical protein